MRKTINSISSAPPMRVDGSLRSSGQRRPTLVQQAMRQLLHDIMQGIYGPGDRIPEEELAARLGVSRAPVREALRSLAQDGLVEQMPRHGVRVIDPSSADIAALFDLLGAVYGTVARLAVRNATNSDLQRFSTYLDRFTVAESEGQDIIQLLDLAYRIGTHLGRSCSSTTAADTLRRLGRSAYWMHRYIDAAPRRWRQQTVSKFQKLERALIDRSEHRSDTAARQLVQHTRRLILEHASLPS